MSRRTYAKRARYAALALILSLAMSVFLLTGGLSVVTTAFAAGNEHVNPDREIHYYTYDVENCNFGPDVYAEAKQMVEDGKASSIQDAIFHVDENGAVSGIMRDRMTLDPALTAAITVDILNRSEIDWYSILGDRQNEFKDIEIGRLADQLHLAFLKNHDFWDQVIANDLNLLKSGKVSIEKISDYTSSMYMIEDMLEGDKPSVVVRNSTNAGGHVIRFDLGKAGVYQYRLECGFQPIQVDYWPTPDVPPIPDEPEPEPTPTPTPTPEPEPTPTPEPKPTPTPEPKPTPTPTLEPKNPNAGPQAQTGGTNPDYGGGQNQDNDTTITDEPSSPSTYTPPARPSGGTGSSGTGGTGGSQSQSGSPTVDHNNGTHETHGGQDYQVQAGDGQNHTDLGTVQEQASHDTVEAPVQDDGVNEGNILPPE